MLREILGADRGDNAGLCSMFTCQHINSIRERALARGETPPETDVLLDRVIAPVMYRILFTRRAPDASYARDLLETVLDGTD